MNDAARQRLEALQAKWLGQLEADQLEPDYQIGEREMRRAAWRVSLIQCVKEAELALAASCDRPFVRQA